MNEKVDWYEQSHTLRPGMAFTDYEGSTVRLYQRVPGDGTKWFVEVWDDRHESWFYYADTCEPGDLKIRIPKFDC